VKRQCSSRDEMDAVVLGARSFRRHQVALDLQAAARSVCA